MILTGIGLPDDGLHSPNEKLELQQLWDGIEIFARFFELFGEQGTIREAEEADEDETESEEEDEEDVEEMGEEEPAAAGAAAGRAEA